MVNSKINNNSYKVEFDETNKFRGVVNTNNFEFVIKSKNTNNYCVVMDGVEYDIDIISADSNNKTVKMFVNGRVFDFALEDKFDLLIKDLGFKDTVENSEKEIKSTMPGLIIDVHVQKGSIVSKGDGLITLEAMKMENIIKASENYIIKEVSIKKGDTVEKNDVLFELE